MTSECYRISAWQLVKMPELQLKMIEWGLWNLAGVPKFDCVTTDPIKGDLVFLRRCDERCVA